jgi:hypothetical protein
MAVASVFFIIKVGYAPEKIYVAAIRFAHAPGEISEKLINGQFNATQQRFERMVE